MKSRTLWTIIIIGAILRAIWINVPPLWYDENFTLILARLPFMQMLQATAGDVHPPLWYIIEWMLSHISPSLPVWWAVRIFAWYFSVVSMMLFAETMRLLDINPKVQTAALIVMAIMPFQIWYAQEGRMYAMLEFFVLFTLNAALTQNYFALFIGSLGLLYTQNYGPFYIVAIALVILARVGIRNINKLNWYIASMASAVALYIPWFMIVSRQMSDIAGRYWIMDKSLGALLIILYKLFLTAAVPTPFFFASYVVTFGALSLGLYSFIRSTHPSRSVIAIMAFVPLFIAWAISIAWQPVLLFRPLIGISPFLYLITCWVLDSSNLMQPKS